MALQSQPFDPLEFLDLARSLGQTSNDEASLRTAVGRVYYALFLVARSRIATTVIGKAVHAEVIKHVKQRDRSAGDQLATLRRFRNVADYELMPLRATDRNWRQSWSTVDRIAQHILPRLQHM